jgi:carbon monoxide dehydrogenase subunit G
MEFDNSFEVPLPPDKAWATLMDIKSIAPCMPGAELTEIVDDTTFVYVDDTAHKATVKAQGADAKGRGGANANVAFHLEPSDAGSTVKIHTDLQLSGSVAQYGRGAGMIQDLAGQIIGQFATNLSQKIEAEMPADAEAAANDAPTTAPVAAPAQVGNMAFRVMWNQIVRSFRSLFGMKD